MVDDKVNHVSIVDAAFDVNIKKKTVNKLYDVAIPNSSIDETSVIN